MSDDELLKAIPVAEFEGEFVRQHDGKMPAIVLDMPEGYPRGMHLVLEAEVRVRNIGYVEDKKTKDLTRHHELVLEEIRLKEAFDPAARPNVIGGSVGEAWEETLLDYLHGDVDELDFDGEQIPDRLRALLEAAFDEGVKGDGALDDEAEAIASIQTAVQTPAHEGGDPNDESTSKVPDWFYGDKAKQPAPIGGVDF